MTTYVLVHGAWSGAHTFRLVRPLLAEGGHGVFTPSLTGIGERSHLTSPQVDLSTHIYDVVNLVLYEDLRDIVLLGYSYGGMVVTGALHHIGDRVRHLVYLDAFVPGDGQSVFGLVGVPADDAISIGAEWLVPPAPRQFDDPVEGALMTERRTPHPRRCFTEAVRLSRPLEEHPFGRTYIRATADVPGGPGAGPFDVAATHARTSPAWEYREIATNHMVASNRPRELTDLLVEVG